MSFRQKRQICLFGALVISACAWTGAGYADDKVEAPGASKSGKSAKGLYSPGLDERGSIFPGIGSSDDVVLRGSLIADSDMDTDLKGSRLPSIVESALNSHPELKATKEDLHAAQENEQREKLLLLPTVSMSAEISERNATFGSISGTSTSRDIVSLTADWNLFNGGTNWAGIASANLESHAAAYRHLASERRVLFEAVELYVDLLASRRVINTMDLTIKRLKRIRSATRKRFNAGFASKTDVDLTDAEIAAVRAQRAQAVSTLHEREAAFRAHTGRRAPKHIKTPDIGRLLPSTLAATKRRALSGNFTVQAAELSAQSAGRQADAVRGQYLPKLSLFGQVSTRLLDPGFSRDEYDWRVGVRLSAPITNVSGLPHVRQMRRTAAAAEYRAQDTRRLISRDIEINWAKLQGLAAQLKAQRARRTAIRRVVTGIGKQVEAGLRPVGDLLREQINLARSEVDNLQLDILRVATAYRIAIHFSDFTLSDLGPRT